MNFPDISSVMSTASGSGNGGSNNNHNHNVYSNNGLKHDPFSFLEEDGGDGDITMGLMVKPLRDPLISLDDLDDFINNVEISDAIVPSSSLTLSVSTGLAQATLQGSASIFSQAPMQQMPQQPQFQMQQLQHQELIGNDDQDRRTNAASAAATSALLKSWMVPQELISESASGFAMVLDPSGTIEYVSDTVRCHVGHPGQLMRGQSIYSYVAQADHEKIALALHPQNLVSSQNAEKGSRITANTDLNYRRTFAVRFLVGNHSKSTSSGFESLFVSSVPLHRASKATPSLLCVARKIVTDSTNSQQSQTPMNQQSHSHLQGPTNQFDIFSTRLDPTSFRITHTSTDKPSLSSRVSNMLGKSFLEFCSHEDQDIVRAHFLETLQSTNEISPTVSKPYRIIGLLESTEPQQQQRFVRIQTRSKYIKSSNHQEKGFITSTHSVCRGTDVTTAPPQTFPTASTSISNPLALSNKPSTANMDADFNQTRPPRRTRSPPLSPPSESQQKNLLLKQLLNTTYSCADEDPSRGQSPPVPNTRILQLLNQSENVPRLKRGEDGSKSVSPQPAITLNSPVLSTTRQRLKRSASGSALDDEPFIKNSASSLDSPVCRENPSLVNLLVKPLPIAVPPPVPTKWHQEPKEKLPKDTMRKFLPPHPADRVSIASATTTSSGATNSTLIGATASKSFGTLVKSSESVHLPISQAPGLLLQTAPTDSSTFLQSQTLSNVPQSASPFLDISLNDNDILSEILEGLIDFQEKSPVGRVMDPIGSPAVAAISNQPESHISSIEKYLASSEKTVLAHQRSSDQPKASGMSSNSTLSSLLSSPPMGPSPTSHVSGNSAYMSSVQQQGIGAGASRQSPASLVHRMSELLQAVPPNVSVTDAPQSSMESIMMQDRRRRMSSGGGNNVIPFPQQSQIQRPVQQQQRLPYTGVVDPREVIPSAAFPARPLTRPVQHQQFGSVKSPVGLPASPQSPYSTVSSSFQTFSGGSVMINQQPTSHAVQSQMQPNSNFVRRASYSGPVQSQPQTLNHGMQQNTTMLSGGHSAMLSGGVQLPHRRASGNNAGQDICISNDDKRSLLQKLLSE